MIEISFLPNDAVLATLKMFPVANDLGHGLVACEREERMEMAGHQQKQRDVPALSDLIESGGIEQRSRERRTS
jgi:hypothetical protein